MSQPTTPGPRRPRRRSGAYLVYRSRIIIGLTLGLANVVGGALVFAFAAWLIPSPSIPNGAALIKWNGIAAAIYVGVSTPVGAVWSRLSHMGAESWLIDGRQPTAAEVRKTLGAPRRLTVIQVTFWAIAAVGFTTVNGIINPLLIGRVGMTVVCGGLTTAALTFLLAERIDRPVVARALEHDPDLGSHRAGVTSRTLLAWIMGTGMPLLGIVAAGLSSLVLGQGTRTQLAVAMVALGGVGLLVGFFITLLGARSVAAPVRAVRKAMARIADGDLDVAIDVNSGTEVGFLQAGFNRMAAGLRERERIQDLFGRHVGDDVARAALERDIDLRGEARVASVLFVDVVASTDLATTMAPQDVLALLNQFFAVVVDVVDGHGGWINKFIGDAAMAVFGTPEPLDDHAGAALASGRELAERLRDEVPTLDFGIGVSTGSVVAGHLGDERRYEYTIIGDPVNVAARLTDIAKRRPARLLADAAAVSVAGSAEGAEWTPCEEMVLRGRTGSVAVAAPTLGIDRPVPPIAERRGA